MILFSIAFGAEYIDALLNRCLPSVLANSPEFPDDPLSLLILTRSEDHSLFDSLDRTGLLRRYIAQNRLKFLRVGEGGEYSIKGGAYPRI